MPNSSVNHGSEPSEAQSTLAYHSRNISAVSSVTLHTNTTLHSQPYEPLLRPITPGSGEYYDVVSHQSLPSDRILSLPRWSQSNVMSRHSSPLDEKKSFYSDIKVRKRGTLLRWSKNILQTIMAVWAIYNTARYLLAFTVYQSMTGQAYALALGIATGLSFTFASCATILYMTQTFLIIHGFSVQALLSLRKTLHYLSSCCLFGPSVINVILVFIWRKTADLELQPKYRCKLDIDLVWSAKDDLCNYRTRTWGFWVALSLLRLLLTLSIIIAFHLITSSAQLAPPKKIAKPRYPKGKKSHVRLDSCQSPLINRHDMSETSVVVPNLSHDQILQRQPSESTLSAKSSPRNRLRPSRSRVSAVSDDLPAPSYENMQYIPMNSDHNDHSSFTDRFRSLIDDIYRETDDALTFARSDSSSSHNSFNPTYEFPPPLPAKEHMEQDIEEAHRYGHYDYEEEDDFYSSSAEQTLSPHNYHQAYPEEEHVRMMNGYVRKLPTIESMGSKEWRSSFGASSRYTDREQHGSQPTRGARPSLGETDIDISGSQTRSRSNSLTAQAELLVGTHGRNQTSEIGEIVRRGDTTIRIVDAQSTNTTSTDGHGDDYFTATTGSNTSSLSLNKVLADPTNSPSRVSPSSLHVGSPS